MKEQLETLALVLKEKDKQVSLVQSIRDAIDKSKIEYKEEMTNKDVSHLFLFLRFSLGHVVLSAWHRPGKRKARGQESVWPRSKCAWRLKEMIS